MKLKTLLCLILALLATLTACGGETNSEVGGESSASALTSVAGDSSEERMDYIPYIAKANENGDGTVTVTVSLPEGISFGSVCIKVSDNLEYVADSMESPIDATINPAYSRDGISGQYATFASASVYDEGSVVFTADYKIVGASVGSEDFAFPKWELGDGTRFLSDNTTGEITVQYTYAARAY